MKKYNFAVILKEHKGEIFYSPAYGNIMYTGCWMGLESKIFLNFKRDDSTQLYFTCDGKIDLKGELMVFPSKNQRDWDKWIEENSIPKTWSQYNQRKIYGDFNFDKIDKSHNALYKILKLIEVGYGGLVTNEEWKNTSVTKYNVSYNNQKECFDIQQYIIIRNPITFHTLEQAEEFISYEENIQLLKDYYMI